MEILQRFRAPEEKQQQKNMIALKLLEGIPLFAAAIPFIYYFQPIYGPLREQQQPTTSRARGCTLLVS
jgi:hypothetical protein